MASTSTSTYKFNHTMLRIKDPKVAIPWFEKVLGMEKFYEAGGSDFTNFFLAFPNGFPEGVKTDEQKKDAFKSREGILELCWNHGTESDPNFKGYANGNSEPGRGFGHICISVDNLDAACKRFDELGVKFKKRPEEGRMRNIAFILTPDDEYWVEIIAHDAKV
ncbi:putative lactoylglutathione lyase [Papiliotrema laurentii]|uniref:lactoylglutathione lyase n=1 Tax=Papiliotrema laurentii TaxID=5418 RepID=A0AAD9FP44_PAPLA|nr:putative lactoylglutathione lyase [Papiliotrema laurentii]